MEPVNNNLQHNQNKSGFLGVSTAIAAPALVFFMIFCIIPFCFTLALAFKNYSIMQGIFNSAWVGLANFEQLFQGHFITRVIWNTFAINGLSVFLGGIYVFLLTLGLAAIRNKWVKGIAASLVILPAFIPVPILIGAMLKNSFLKENFLLKSSDYWLSAVGNEVLALAPIAVLAGLFACFNKFDMKKVLFITFGYVVVRFMLLFSSDLNYIYTSYNPLVYETGDVLGTYMFRTGLTRMDFSGTAAIYIVKVLLQLIPVMLGILAINFFASKMQKKFTPNFSREEKTSPAAILSILVVIPAVIFLSVAITSVPGVNILTNSLIRTGLINSVLLSVIGGILVVAFSFFLAYGMAVDNKIIPIFNSLFLLFGGNIIGQYLQMRSLHMFNTYFPIIISGILVSCIGTYFIFFATGGIQKIPFGEFFKKSLPVLLAMLGVGFARFYSNVFEPVINLSDKRLYPVSVLLHEMTISDQRIDMPITSASTFVLLLVPVVVGLAGVWTGVVLQKKQME